MDNKNIWNEDTENELFGSCAALSDQEFLRLRNLIALNPIAAFELLEALCNEKGAKLMVRTMEIQ